ncbi:hypothetical protein [Streptomyces sp. CBMA156]|uniref:hypothetical protein n=1 Tax=Streptomyces sp. CBMA156 TaxID=1930280 RepID=UPI001661C75C|nr:hypothetical protein [Streptomyces sp. CBMA156]
MTTTTTFEILNGAGPERDRLADSLNDALLAAAPAKRRQAGAGQRSGLARRVWPTDRIR